MNARRCLCTASFRCTPTTTPAALEHTARRSTIPLEQIAARMGRSAKLLARQTNPDDPTAKLAAEDVPLLMQAAESTLPIDVQAHEMGGAFVRLPDVAATPDEIFDAFARAVTDLGRTGEALRTALSDREITLTEGDDVARKCDALMAQTAAVKVAVLSRITAKPAALRMALASHIAARRLA